MEQLYEAATEILYSAPCDLAEAERRVAAYQRSIVASLGGQRS
jgi:hypothetical protein